MDGHGVRGNGAGRVDRGSGRSSSHSRLLIAAAWLLCVLNVGAQTLICSTNDSDLASEAGEFYATVQALRAEHRFDEAYHVATEMLTAIDVRVPDASTRGDRTGTYLAQMRAFLHFAAADLARNSRHWADAHQHLDAVSTSMSLLTGGSFAPSAWDVRLLNLRGDIFLDSGSPERARPAYHAAQSAARDVAGDDVRAALLLDCERRRSRVLLASADARAALAAAHHALSMANGDDPRRATLLHDLGLAAEYASLERREVSEDAARWQREALALAATNGLRDDVNLALARLALRTGDLAVASEHLDAVSVPGRRLSRLSARLARLRHDTEGIARAAVTLEAEFEGMLAAWRATPPRESGVAHLHFARDRALLAEVAAIDLARHERTAGARRLLERLLRTGALSTLDRKRGTQVPTVDDTLAALGPGDGLLVYLPTSTESSFVVIATERAIDVAEIPSHYEVESRRTRWVDALRGGARVMSDGERSRAIAEERQLARAFSACILPDAITHLVETCSRLTIVAGDALGFVPFGWLPCGRHEYLGVSVALDMWPTLPLGHHLRSLPSAVSPSLSVLLVTDAERSPAQRARWPRLDDLPGAGEVASDLGSLSPDVEFRWPHGSEASWSAIAPSLANADLATWIVHGVRDPRRARPVGLLIEETDTHDGVIWCSDVEASSAPRAVAMLACRVGAGAVRRGDAASATMAGAWIAAGARVVIEAHSDLRFGDAVSASRVMHRALAAGASPAEALRRVRADVVERFGDEAPFRDGLLQVVGAGHTPLVEATAITPTPTGTSPVAAVALAAVLLLISVAVVMRVKRAA